MKRTLSKVEFYINHTCNLTCNNCNRFNNHSFSGWQRYSDYEPTLQKWQATTNIEQLVIMGGEPLLNPSLLDWIQGLNRLWNQPVQILTNGTRLTKTKGLYELLGNETGNWLGISWHNRNHKEQLLEQIYGFLHGVVSCSRDIDGELQTGEQLEFRDENNVKITVWVQDEFGPAAIKSDFSLHNSDPEQAHASCGFVQNKCYHMIEGKLYKCGPVHLMPEFDKQNPLNISDEERQLLHNYRGYSYDDDLADIDQVIPQCRFCPLGFMYSPELIYPEVKGKKQVAISTTS